MSAVSDYVVDYTMLIDLDATSGDETLDILGRADIPGGDSAGPSFPTDLFRGRFEGRKRPREIVQCHRQATAAPARPVFPGAAESM